MRHRVTAEPGKPGAEALLEEALRNLDELERSSTPAGAKHTLSLTR